MISMEEVDKFSSEKNVLNILDSLYGLTVDTISEISSYFNVNYLVKVRQINGLEHHKYIVKIIDTRNDSFFDNMDLQQIIMEHLNVKGVGSARPIKTIEGDSYLRSKKDDSNYILQVLTFLPGQSVTSTIVDAEELDKIFYNVGIHMARFHISTKDLSFDTSSMDKNFYYLPENALQCCSKISYAIDENTKNIIVKHMESFRKNFLPRLGELRKGFIHNDFSDSNVIIRKKDIHSQSKICGMWEVSGIIDFEHCHYGYLIGELGISIAYHMTKSISTSGSDIIKSTKQIIKGYQSMNPLTSLEKTLLLEVVLSRLGVSYIIGCYQSSLFPGKKDSIMMQSKYIPRVFEIIENVGKEKILIEWFESE